MPNFKLAHLIHGDLLTARSGNLNYFGGRIYKSNPDVVKDFKEEASRRIKYYLQNSQNLTPNFNIQLSQKYKYLIYVDVKSSRLFTYKNDNGRLVFNSDHYVSIGKNGFDKNGTHIATHTLFDTAGFDKDGFDKLGKNKQGLTSNED